jgi:hypothetical protein
MNRAWESASCNLRCAHLGGHEPVFIAERIGALPLEAMLPKKQGSAHYPQSNCIAIRLYRHPDRSTEKPATAPNLEHGSIPGNESDHCVETWFSPICKGVPAKSNPPEFFDSAAGELLASETNNGLPASHPRRAYTVLALIADISVTPFHRCFANQLRVYKVANG